MNNKYEEMREYLRNVQGCVQTLNFPEIRFTASCLKLALERFNNAVDKETALDMFYIISFTPFKKEADEIINNF